MCAKSEENIFSCLRENCLQWTNTYMKFLAVVMYNQDQ